MILVAAAIAGFLIIDGIYIVCFRCPIEDYTEIPGENTIYLDFEEFKTYYYLSPEMYVLLGDRAYAYPGKEKNPELHEEDWWKIKDEMTEIRFHKEDFRKYWKFWLAIRDGKREMTMNKAYSKFLVDRVQRDINIRRDQANKEIRESTQAMKDIAAKVIDDRIQEMKKESDN